MFDKKMDLLIPKTAKTPKSNPFVKAGLVSSAPTGKISRRSPKRSIPTHVSTLSGNMALKSTTTGDVFVDEFGTASRFRAPRTFADISSSMQTLWNNSRIMCLKFLFYLRMVTRQVQFADGTTTDNVQRGQGLKHEGIFRMMWLAVYKPATFWNNIHLFIAVGGWKDIITMLQYDLVYNNWNGRKLDWNKMGKLILAGLENERTTNLVKKYLPQIKANSNCKTVEAQADNMIAKWICSLIFGGKVDVSNSANYKAYRKLKTSGTAHEWQKIISQKKLLKLDFNTIHGRALALLVGGKFLKNNGLESKYTAWISKKPVAKFTGYVYELGQAALSASAGYQLQTVDAQYNKLLETAKAKLDGSEIRPISALDTSSSMNSFMYIGSGQVGKMSSRTVAVASSIFFDDMILPGSPFKNVYLEFNNNTTMKNFSGKTFTERFLHLSRQNGWGGTSFESVFKFFADFRRNNPHVPENQIPNMILCFSDGEFNKVSTGLKTNVVRGREILKQAGYSKNFYENFGIGFIDLPNTFYSSKPTPKFETFGDVKNVFYFSGHDLAPLAFLFGIEGAKGLPGTARELFDAAMDQEVLNMLEV